MRKLLLLCLALMTLTACEKEQQALATAGKAPKQIIDKTTDDINKATALVAERMNAAENEANPKAVEK
jgi:uncharacterized protein YcfL